MNSEDHPKRALEGMHVLDLTTDRGWLCGRILADLGAEVIKIEKPGGDPGRRIGPFYQDNPEPNNSLYWHAYNLNKLGITLDIEKRDGRKLFHRLLEQSDVVIESFEPGYMKGLQLDYDPLSQVKSGLIMTSITPFGSDGPLAQHRAHDLEILGMGNVLYHQGDIDRPPVRASLPQSFLHGALEAAVGTMIAFYFREQTGVGQHVDASCQESCATMTTLFRTHWEASGTIVLRSGSRSRWRGTKGSGPRVIFKCKDGLFCYTLFGGAQGARSNKALVDWIEENGMPTNGLEKMDWMSFSYDNIEQEGIERITRTFGSFFEKHTKEYLYKGARQKLFMGVPVMDIKDLAEDRQLEERRYWEKVYQPDLEEEFTYPGPFANMSETPIRYRYKAPRTGEHNLPIYRDRLGLSLGGISLLREGGII